MASLKTETEWCRRLQGVLAVGLGLCLVTFYLAGWRPMTSRQRDLNVEIASKHAKLETSQRDASRLPQVTLEVERLKLRLERIDKRLPRQQELTQFIKDLTRLSQQSSLRRLTTEPSSPRRSALFGEHPITLTFQGRFPDVFSFLRQTEEMERLTRVRSVRIRSLDAEQGMVDVTVLLSIYFSEG